MKTLVTALLALMLPGCVSGPMVMKDSRCRLAGSAVNPFNGRCYPTNVFDTRLKAPLPAVLRSWGTAPIGQTTSAGRSPEMAIGVAAETPDNPLGIGPVGGRPSVTVGPHAGADGPGSTNAGESPDVP